MSEAETPRNDRTLDFDGLKGLAHPMRVAILDRLSVHGASTASGLAEALGESSGATSYHLRQLERHGFVREVEGRGTGRERWWERSPGGISVSPDSREQSPAAKAASDLILQQWERNRSELLGDFLERGDSLGMDWVLASLISTANLRLTRDQAMDVQRRLEALIDELVDEYRGKDDPGSRPVQMHINLFPVVDAAETPSAPSNDGGSA
jgi:DNA-binding transcriptional ArsR family regulator